MTGASHIVFVVREDGGTSDVLFQTSDTTWQAYNRYGGNSLYGGTGPGTGLSGVGRAYKVSYNRPVQHAATTRPRTGSSTPSTRWCAGWSRTATTSATSPASTRDRRGAELLDHKVFLSVGHDEYWSGQQRANVEAARDATPARAPRLLQRQRDLLEDALGDEHRRHRHRLPHARLLQGDARGRRRSTRRPTWTGTWRDPRFSPPADGGRPENALTGTIFTVNGCATTRFEVPEADGKMRFWRNTPDVADARHRPGLVGADRHARLRVGRGPRQRLPSRGTRTALDDDGQRHDRRRAGLRVDLRAGHGHAPPGLPQAAERRARVRRRHRAVVVGARRRARPRQRRRPAVDMQQATVNLLRRHGRAARDAAGRARPGLGLDRRRRRPSPTSPRPASGATVPVGTPVTIQGTAADGRAAWSAGSRCRSTAARPGTPRSDARAGPTSGRPPASGSVRHPLPRRRRQRQPRDARRREDGHRHDPPPPSGAVSIWAGGGSPSRDEPERRTADRARRQVPLVARGLHHRPPLLQGHPGRRARTSASLWSAAGTLLATATVRRRDGVRLAGGDARLGRRDRGEHDLRRVLPLVAGLLRGDDRRTSRRRSRTAR